MNSYQSSYTEDDLIAIENHIKKLSTGQAVAEYEVRGRKVKYQYLSLDELKTLYSDIKRQLNARSKHSPKKYSVITTSKGL